jgi:hypothetical protein
LSLISAFPQHFHVHPQKHPHFRLTLTQIANMASNITKGPVNATNNQMLNSLSTTNTQINAVASFSATNSTPTGLAHGSPEVSTNFNDRDLRAVFYFKHHVML